MNDRERKIELIKKAQNGSERAMNKLLKEEEKYVYAIAYSLLKNREDAEEATQMTLIAVWQNLGSLQHPEAFQSWLYRIAHTKSLFCLKVRRKNFDLVLDDDISDVQQFLDMESDLLLPQEYAEKGDLKERLFHIIEGLSDVQRETIVLFYYHDKSIAEIAEIMDCGENTVKTRLFLARKAIKTEIEAQEKKSGEKFFGFSVGILPIGKFVVENTVLHLPKARVFSGILKNAKIAAAATAGSGSSSTAAAASAAGTAAVSLTAKATIISVAKVSIAVLGTAAVIGAGASITSGTNPWQYSSENHSSENSSTEQATYSKAYRSYLDLLQNKESIIKNYGAATGDNDPDVVTFADLTGDGVPEMVYLSADDLQTAGTMQYGFGDMDIVTYNEDTGSIENLYHDDNWFVNAAAGGLSCLFTTDSGIYQCLKNADEKELVGYYQFSYQGGKFERTEVAGNKDADYAYPYTVQDALGTDVTSILISSLKENVLGAADSVEDKGMTYDEAIDFLKGNITATSADDVEKTAAQDTSSYYEEAAGQFMVPANSYFRQFMNTNADGTIEYFAKDNTADGMGKEYKCTAKMSNAKKVGDYEYTFDISDSVIVDGEEDMFDNIDSITVYLPGMPISDIPEDISGHLDMIGKGDLSALDCKVIITSRGNFFID